MATIIPVNGIQPQVPDFLAPTATLVGDVRMGAECSVWFGAVLRGDINYVELGDRANVQDNCVLHVSQARPCVIGARTSLGHCAVAHACVVGEDCLLGMNSVVLDGAVVGDGCLVAAGCVVSEGMHVPPNHLVAGLPGRIIKPLKPELQARIRKINGDYVAYQQLYPEILAAAQAD
ncbi:MAG: gamma carbonic anhydrase family protein [Planctomycetota bacterium]|jgi:carbonic anhydrase/acetyltransferase-like protein (isoleucine patch superfamily)|nr:gamma carbonic anhydrase family protein [Planctomycetota bacterium]